MYLKNLILQQNIKSPSASDMSVKFYKRDLDQQELFKPRSLSLHHEYMKNYIHLPKKFCKMAIIEFCNLLHEIGSSRTNQFAVKVSSTTNHVWRFASVGLKGQFTFSTAFIIVVATTIPTVASSSTFNFSHSSK